MPSNKTKPFSQALDSWLKSNKPKTLGGLTTVVSEKSFALLFLVLMAIPALPLPTGGLTHVFEVINALVALELIAGRTTVWLPQRWLDRPLGKSLEQRSLPYLVRKIRWMEKYARRRGSRWLQSRNALRLVGLIVLAFTVAAFVSPPFSGLDTLPAMGVVGIALALILDDIVIFGVGLIFGALGILLEVSLGAAIVRLFQHYF